MNASVYSYCDTECLLFKIVLYYGTISKSTRATNFPGELGIKLI